MDESETFDVNQTVEKKCDRLRLNKGPYLMGINK
jgi:hypothetical protein